MLTPLIGALAGLVLGAPTLRLRGDYLAIVTLGFGEIVQDVLRNLENITRGTQGINPLAVPDAASATPSCPRSTSPGTTCFLAILAAGGGAHPQHRGVAPRPGLRGAARGRAGGDLHGHQHVKIKLMAFALGAGARRA